VLRGRLTNKHIDVAELIAHVRFEPVTPNILKGSTGSVPGEDRFETPAADFELRRLVLQKDTYIALTAATCDIFFVYEGAVEMHEEHHKLAGSRGEAILATAGASYNIHALEDAVLFRATVPQ